MSNLTKLVTFFGFIGWAVITLGLKTKQVVEESWSSNNIKYIVKEVIDGDTILLTNGQKVRYIGIDTPETVKPRTKVQCFGKEASEANKKLVEGKEVTLEKDVSNTDKYGRWLRYVYVDGKMINERLVVEGYAKTATYPPEVKYQEKFLMAERTAREKNLGLWDKCKN